jgi:hypothetical protein
MIDDGEVGGVDLTIDVIIFAKCKRCRLCMHWALRSGNGDIDLDVDSIHVTIRDCSRYPKDVRDLISS